MASSTETVLATGTLRDNRYYSRTVAPITQPGLGELMQASRDVLIPIIRNTFPEYRGFDPTNPKHVDQLIQRLEAQKNPDNKNKLTLLMDFKKINELNPMSIPGEGNRPKRVYCHLAESAGGVTEKLSLVSMDRVQTQLGQLGAASDITTLDAYMQQRARFQLNTEAILKLPKHKDIREVQREAMALNSSRRLGLDTAESSMVRFNNQPALFVPFAPIQLLQDFAQGETFQAVSMSRQSYQHYATLNTVGEGMEANQHIDDFGHALGLFVISQDPDAIGGYIQNKGLIGGKSLFIFDQVIMGKDKMGLDSRLSLQPTEFLMKHTRHGQGRNRTLIEDSSMLAKFDSLMKLKAQAPVLYNDAQRCIDDHNDTILALQQSKSPEAQAMIRDLRILRDDAVLLRDTVDRRIRELETIFPRRNETVTDEELRQSLILEKLTHKPVLFTDSGRPYRNPWTQRHNNPVQSIRNVPGTDHFELTFKDRVDADTVAFINESGCPSLKQVSPNRLTLTRADLLALNETMLNPEHQSRLDPERSYLRLGDLRRLQKAYKAEDREDIINLVKTWHRQKNIPGNELKALQALENGLLEAARTSRNPGFAKHVLKKYHMEAQKEMQKLIHDPEVREQVNAAFHAARTLDRSGDFNRLLRDVIDHGKTQSTEFRQTLAVCVGMADEAKNHHEAQTASRGLQTCLQSCSQALELGSRAASTQRREDNSSLRKRFSDWKQSVSRVMSSLMGDEKEITEENRSDHNLRR